MRKVYVVQVSKQTSDALIWEHVGAFLSKDRAEALWEKHVEANGGNPMSAFLIEMDLNEDD